jgi:hypothetical protein
MISVRDPDGISQDKEGMRRVRVFTDQELRDRKAAFGNGWKLDVMYMCPSDDTKAVVVYVKA